MGKENAQGLDVLWAKIQIESINLNRSMTTKAKKEQITALGLTHHIVTNYTSLVALEKKMSRKPNQAMFDK
ncbi:MAG TPA: hypothetical protein EYH12_06205 [Psychromonas hadalis]|nr:hypothetical protein [Psychromonas hadalis]